MKNLTKNQIVKICDSVIKKLKTAKENGTFLFLCSEIKTELQAIEYRERYEINIELYIPEFTKINAVIMANALSEYDSSVWWYGTKLFFDYDNRIKFMEFIKECYQN